MKETYLHQFHSLLQTLFIASNYRNVRAFLGQQNREGKPQARRATCNITMLRRELMFVGDGQV